jgi:hypothetical protein
MAVFHEPITEYSGLKRGMDSKERNKKICLPVHSFFSLFKINVSINHTW